MHISVASGSASPGPELTRFGKYHLIASLGQGGMAKVYLALIAGPSDFNKLLVIKIMRQDVLASDGEGARMFWAEARLAARLLHPNIVHTYEVGEQDGRSYLAMEYLDGQPLSAVLNRARADRDISLAELIRVVSEVAHGLHYAHQLKGFQGEALHVVHRDVSPQNIILTYEGQAKLLDFGIAKTVDGEQTQLGMIKGKLDYIAPEQLRGELIDARADVFSLGVILWEIIAGQRFAGGRKVSDVVKVQTRLVAGERKLSAAKPDAPPELVAIVERAVATAPGDRYQDAESFADALDGYLERHNLRPNPRVLAAQLGSLFTNERAALHKLIDTQVQRVKRGKVEGEDLTTETTPTDRRKLQSGFGLFVADAHQEERSAIRDMSGTGTGSLRAHGVRGSTVAPAHTSRALVAWALGSMLVAASLMFMWLTRREPDSTAQREAQREPRSAASQTAPSAPPTTALPPLLEAPQSARPNAQDGASSTVTLKLRVSPGEAHVLLDGALLSSPFEGAFRRDTTLHHLEVSAEGYRPVREYIRFDVDKTVELTLERSSSPRRAAYRQLIERAEHSAEPVPPAPAASAPAEEPAPRLEAPDAPVMERPNPYSVD